VSPRGLDMNRECGEASKSLGLEGAKLATRLRINLILLAGMRLASAAPASLKRNTDET
jgi:hypothetical protein